MVSRAPGSGVVVGACGDATAVVLRTCVEWAGVGGGGGAGAGTAVGCGAGTATACGGGGGGTGGAVGIVAVAAAGMTSVCSGTLVACRLAPPELATKIAVAAASALTTVATITMRLLF